MNFTAERYVADVLNGERLTCEWVRLACERHRRDMETGHERGLYFDEQAARLAVAWFRMLQHWKGEWAGRQIHLEPWQQFITWSLFGWKREEDDTRRFRTAYISVARKNGKTTWAAGIGLYLMLADGEPGAEVYSSATKRDQARISHEDAVQMVKRSAQLRKVAGTFKDNIYSTELASKFEPLGRDSDSLDGLNIHGVIADEVHAWKNRDTWDVLETATGARRQPLMLAITTAGFDRQSLCYQLDDYAQKVLSGTIQDDSFFGIIYTLDKGDLWTDERNWVKANPNLEVSKKVDDMRRLAARAKEMPAALNAFLRLHLNIWTQAETRWINREKWDECGGEVDEEQLAGRRCYGGLDLSSTTDLTAWVLVFPPVEKGDPFQVLPRFFIPEENVHLRSRNDRVPYEAWMRQGFIQATPGNVIDYDWILEQIDRDAQAFDVKEIAFDRWGATRIVTDLMELGGEDWVVQFGQGFASMSGPMKDLERLYLAGKLAHGGHPVLTWNADNLVARIDPAGNVKPDKERSREKIDGIVALIMALDRALRHLKKTSVYEGRGLRTL